MNLWTKLSLLFGALIGLALLLAGATFIALRRGERERATLEHLAAVAPQITLELRATQRRGLNVEQARDLIDQAARLYDVRVLLVDERNTVTIDSGGTLTGRSLLVPREPRPSRSIYRSWEDQGPDGERLVFLYVPQGATAARLARLADAPDEIIVAVPAQTVAGAWRDLLPGLLAAGALALLASLVVSTLIARSIARPLVLLTRASEAMARGDYDQAIPVQRADEVGRLAAAFNTMSREVGRTHVQMRTLIENVSHDLKTPLTSIRGFSQALRDRAVEEPAEIAETGGIIHEEAERVQALVDDLLYLSEIEAGQVVLARRPLDLGALVERRLRRFAPRAEERRIAMAAGIAPRLAVAGDATKLERILDNVLDNAVKYAPAGGRITVRCVAAGSEALVAVGNDGPTIPPADLARIFDRFHRLDRARSAGVRGSGLGLAIARELTELHGGRADATSEGGVTTVTLRFPLVAAPEGDPAEAERAETQPELAVPRDWRRPPAGEG